MNKKLQKLNEKIALVADLHGAGAVLSWDQQTKMPPGGAKARADQRGTLRMLAHRFFTEDEIGRLLDDLTPLLDELDPDSDEARIITITRREYDRATRLPTELVGEISRTTSLSSQAWQEARANADFDRFAPHLEKLVDLHIQYAECFAPYENIYDPLLDLFEPGMMVTQIDDVFSGMKPPLVKLVHEISENADAVDGSVLARTVDPDTQMTFTHEVVKAIGYDMHRGRVDLAPHPFTSSSSRYDVRLTTRFNPERPTDGLMSSIHEAGHGMHRQNTSENIYRTMLVNTASQAVGESQSRFYENMVGQSRAFWRFLYPRLQTAFAPAFDDLDMERFYRALNEVKPSLIRVEADEVTYGLHIILRYELEKDLLNGRIKVSGLPAEWNERMESYLGVTPPDDAKGVLQDVHWSMGLFGYFPDYQLGSIFSVQLWDAMLAQHPGVPDEIEAGQFETILGWLREAVMQHGAKFTLPELTSRATGGPLSWEPYMRYLETKYRDIYGL